MREIWFTADTHFNHANIIHYEDRNNPAYIFPPFSFKTVDGMDRYIIETWNHYVKPEDTVYHLGDFAFANKTKQREIREQLNGNIVLIIGNHDKNVDYSMFVDVYDILEKKFKIADEEINVTMCHYPMLSWNRSIYGSWNLFGHVHQLYKFNPYAERSLNVGWDIWERPLNINEIATIFYRQFKKKYSDREI